MWAELDTLQPCSLHHNASSDNSLGDSLGSMALFHCFNLFFCLSYFCFLFLVSFFMVLVGNGFFLPLGIQMTKVYSSQHQSSRELPEAHSHHQQTCTKRFCCGLCGVFFSCFCRFIDSDKDVLLQYLGKTIQAAELLHILSWTSTFVIGFFWNIFIYLALSVNSNQIFHSIIPPQMKGNGVFKKTNTRSIGFPPQIAFECRPKSWPKH